MEVSIKLNDFKYRYDVYHIFNIYFPLQEIKFSEVEGDYHVEIFSDKVVFDYNDCHREALKAEDEKIKETVKKLIFITLKDLLGETYPWGTLIGIRPSKIALKLLRDGNSKERVKEIFNEKHYTSKEKAQLCIDVAEFEDKFVNKDEKNISIYIGMAFCPTRCLYCSFASNPIAGNKKIVLEYLEKLNYEIDEIKKYIDEKKLKIETLYFGGGTPTAIDDEAFENLMNKIFKSFAENRNLKEFTVECGRPDSINSKKLQSMKKYNVTRISINPQTMNDATLKLIGRNHSSEDVIEKFKMARGLGFEDINMDMIIGLPGEGLKESKHTADEIKKLSPDSLTVHGLSIKRGSIMHENFLLKKGLGLNSQDEIMDMYEESKKLSKDLNLTPYYMYRQKNMVGDMENVGFAKKGKECLYNIQMIEDKQTIIALGADAVTKVVFLDENRIERFGNVKDVREYNKRIEEMVEGKKKLLDTLYK